LEALSKLNLLGESAQYEVTTTATGKAKKSLPVVSALCTAQDSGAERATRLMRVLQTNRCDRGCAYCPLRAQNDDVRREKFAPDELARLFMQFADRYMTDGLFLSSGSDGSADASMEDVVKTAAILRERYHYAGYIHLKVLPGTSFSLLEEAARLSDRLSVNLEAPSAERLADISGDKNFFTDIVQRMEWIRNLKAERGWLPAGQSTQLIVGAGQESDHELLKTSSWLYRDVGLNRVYYGAFFPAENTPLSEQKATSPRRQQRLYQSDWLISSYGFNFEELPFTPEGNLPPGIDPKVAMALQQPHLFPVEVNRADYEELIRVPGIGPLSARRITALRGQFPFKTLEALKKTGAVVGRARHFITINGKFQGATQEMLVKAGHAAMSLPESAAPVGRQLTLPFEWDAATILPPRQSISFAELAID
jgi:predicted DNA-binding helix-hairpin-helix protein